MRAHIITLLKPTTEEGISHFYPRFRLSEHRLLFSITLAAVPISLLYSQCQLILPQHLKMRFEDYLGVLATLMSLNGTLVMTFQILLAKLSERWRLHITIGLAYFFLSFVGVGYGLSPTFVYFALAETAFTIGEMLSGPAMQKLIAQIAPASHRGRYFSIFSMNWALSGALGPLMGALAFQTIGSTTWFCLLSVFTVWAGITQVRLVSKSLGFA